MEPVEGVHFIQGDFTEADVLAQLQAIVGDRPVDVVVSDMAPNLSGIDSVDAARITHLIELAVEFAQMHLKPQGALVVKVFHGSGYSPRQIVRAVFGWHRAQKQAVGRLNVVRMGLSIKFPSTFKA
jgi:23S rRNA U2552 (ribose-2'-O)-methylase RlmE/FtsJ